MQKKIFILFLLICALLIADAKIELGLESRDVQVNEAFAFNVAISEAENITPPAFPASETFKCLSISPHRENSRQIAIVNGKMTQTVLNRTTYIFQLVASKTGVHEIPSLLFEIDGKKYKTQPVRITVSEAEKITDIGLELEFPAEKCYVGQPVMATWRWYLGREIRGYSFKLPLLENGNFTIPDYQPAQPNRGYSIYKNGNMEIIGELTMKKWNGYDMQCLEFHYPVIPKKAGTYSIEAGSVNCQIQDKRRARRSRNPFLDDFFDRIPTKNIIINGNTVKLNVLDVPEQGKPEDFSGIIGHCTISAEATPTDVNIGDPIVLVLTISGLPYPEAARIPHLSTQPGLTEGFRISDEDSGKVVDGTRKYQCTIRALNSTITEIPKLSLSYFNPESGKYERIFTNPIPIKVREVKTVTAMDAIGLSETNQSISGGKQIRLLEDGIAHNYPPEDMRTASGAGPGSWALQQPKTIYLLFLVIIYTTSATISFIIRRRNASPEAMAAKAEAAAALSTIRDKKSTITDIAAAVPVLFRAKLKLPAGAETYSDIKPALERKHFGTEYIADVKALFDSCEAARYAGASNDGGTLQAQAVKLADILISKVK